MITRPKNHLSDRSLQGEGPGMARLRDLPCCGSEPWEHPGIEARQNLEERLAFIHPPSHIPATPACAGT